MDVARQLCYNPIYLFSAFASHHSLCLLKVLHVKENLIRTQQCNIWSHLLHCTQATLTKEQSHHKIQKAQVQKVSFVMRV